MSINRVVLIGRMTRDPELRNTTTGKSVASFGIAVDRMKKGETDFFTVTCWGQTAEFVSNYLTKGRLVAIDGRLSQRKYEKDGQTKEIIEIVADNVQGLDKGQAGAAKGSTTDGYDVYADN